jgi:large subunit ribosomal protein L18
MADKNRRKKKTLDRRRYRIRKKVNGTQLRPRLVVHRSLRHIEAQLIDDVAGHSLVGLSTLAKELRAETSNRIEKGRLLGKLLAARAVEKGIHQVVFDRAGSLYHGVVKAVAEGAREGGLNF